MESGSTSYDNNYVCPDYFSDFSSEYENDSFNLCICDIDSKYILSKNKCCALNFNCEECKRAAHHCKELVCVNCKGKKYH